MQNNKPLQHPVIVVNIGGSVVEKHPSEFHLVTIEGIHTARCCLRYPAESEGGDAVGKEKDKITVSLLTDDKTELYFTGLIYAATTHTQYRELVLTDSFYNLFNTFFTAAYRKEKAAVILDDILGAAGITEKSIACPDVELARFSTQNIPARACIDLLIDALREHGAGGLTYFFDAKDIFHFGAKDDTGKNEGENETFEKGRNILRSGPDWIEILPHPIRHTQTVNVAGKERVTVKTDLTVSQKRTRLRLTFGEAL
jgi:hypothetical protein